MGDATFTATLDDGRAARDLTEHLPVTLEVSDFHGKEKVAHLPESLKIYGEPEGFTPAAGDLAYFTPWGNLALFYRDADYAIGLVKLGTLEVDPAVIEAIPDDAELTITLVD